MTDPLAIARRIRDTGIVKPGDATDLARDYIAFREKVERVLRARFAWADSRSQRASATIAIDGETRCEEITVIARELGIDLNAKGPKP